MAPPATRKRGRPRKDEADGNASAKKARLDTSRASGHTTIQTAAGGRKSSTKGSAVWEVPDSDEERQATKTRKPPQKSSAASPKQLDSDVNGIYDFTTSDDDDTAPSNPSARRGRGGHANKTKPESSGTRHSAAKAKPQSSSRAPAPGRALKQAARGTSDRTSRQDGKTADLSAAETVHSCSEDESDPGEVATTPSASRYSRKKRVPAGTADVGSPSLKGILTPSRRNSERNAKSVAFDEPKTSGNPDDIYFADLPSKPVKAKSTPQGNPSGKENQPLEESEQVEEEEDDEEDEVCVICSKPDSKPPNEILFCDSCDLAVHQKCYGVVKIPKGDWLCKDCTSDSGKPSVLPDKKASIKAAEAVPDIPNLERHLRSLQRVLLDRCTGRRRIALRDQDDAYDKTFQLVEQTVVAGEGNSMLIIGARGCGKTTLVESVLADVGLEHNDEFHVVRLNGFIHTDDKLALKDVWRQLGKEMEVEDDLIGKTNNYADTLASLLALLSHPSEIAEAQEGVTSKSVVFIIDEFDLFATHPRQTLLYNLFDIAQARKAPIAVLGLTNRIDVVESLEKRVKSRFSHRYAYMSLPKTFAAYWNVCKQGLTVDDEDAKAEGLDIALPGFAKFHNFWNKQVGALYKDQAFKDHIECHYYSSKSVTAFLGSCVLPLANLSPENLTLNLGTQPGAPLSIEPPDSKLHLLEALSELDLSLLISAARLDIVAHTDTVNFAMAYDEYTTLIGRQRVQSATSGMLALGGGVRVWGRGVAEMAWERLVSLSLLLPTGLGGRHGGIEGRMWKVDVTLEEIPVAVKLSTVLARWCKEI